IVGMPAMIGRVTTLDMTGWTDLQDPEDLAMKVDFAAAPPSWAHTYSVPLQLVDFPATGQQDGGPVPTMAPLPFVDVNVRDDGNEKEGQFLLDTGAQLSLISTSMAIDLGLDKNGNGSLEDEALDHVEVSGIGGTIQIPLVAIDRASVHTD